VICRAALFDLDGTLVDLPVPIEEVRADIAERFAALGWRGDASTMRPLLPTIETAAASVAASLEQARALVAEARAVIDRAEVAAAPAATLLDGAAALLERFAAASIPVAVVTNNCAEAARIALRGFHLAAVIGRGDVSRVKPHPEGLLAAIDQLGVTSAAWIGDRPTDVAAGRAAVARRPELELAIVGFARDPAERAGLEAAGAARVIASLAEL
jgi:phosphoglycolate phosphatase-like HAD superfamily hydrolase